MVSVASHPPLIEEPLFSSCGISPEGTFESNEGNFLPMELLLHIISFLPSENLSKIALTCRHWKWLAWISFWDRIFSWDARIAQPQYTSMANAVNKLELLFASPNEHDKKLLNQFFNRCAVKDTHAQINFIRNVFRAIRPTTPKERDVRFESFLINLFNHRKSPAPCKLKIIDYVYNMNVPVGERLLSWGESKKIGFVPKTYAEFSLMPVSREIALKVSIHPDNHFEEGELVTVINKGNMTLGDSNLFYGRILAQRQNRWLIALEHDKFGQWNRLTLSLAQQIGKLPENMQVLPAIFSAK